MDASLAAERPSRSRDRKSTRLNSSHDQISYAVFCLKKKKNTSELQSRSDLVYRHLLEKKNRTIYNRGRISSRTRTESPRIRRRDLIKTRNRSLLRT